MTGPLPKRWRSMVSSRVRPTRAAGKKAKARLRSNFKPSALFPKIPQKHGNQAFPIEQDYGGNGADLNYYEESVHGPVIGQRVSLRRRRGWRFQVDGVPSWSRSTVSWFRSNRCAVRIK